MIFYQWYFGIKFETSISIRLQTTIDIFQEIFVGIDLKYGTLNIIIFWNFYVALINELIFCEVIFELHFFCETYFHTIIFDTSVKWLWKSKLLQSYPTIQRN
jgi:hypothetical protein